jgi:hypothetical protein
MRVLNASHANTRERFQVLHQPLNVIPETREAASSGTYFPALLKQVPDSSLRSLPG